MNDEKFVFIQDLREKKMAARGGRHKRTHNGKGGAVKLPSDYLSKRELNKMNGETTSYRLNEPMKWLEFKAMPDDLKRTYIEAICEKYNAPESHIALMMGASSNFYINELVRLGINRSKSRSGREKWDKDGFAAWCKGASAPEEKAESIPVNEEKPKTIPCSGRMAFEGKAEDALNTVAAMLGGANVRISVTWSVIVDGEVDV